jgi:hypothetical protein
MRSVGSPLIAGDIIMGSCGSGGGGPGHRDQKQAIPPAARSWLANEKSAPMWSRAVERLAWLWSDSGNDLCRARAGVSVIRNAWAEISVSPPVRRWASVLCF